MKFIKQFSIILLITFLGELLHILIPLPIPASVYGLVLMLIALRSGLVKVEHVKETAVFLIEIMPVMFIPDFWNPGACYSPLGCRYVSLPLPPP